MTVGELCAATGCERFAELWSFSPLVEGLVPTCRPHALDVVFGSTTLKDDAPVLERRRCVA